MDSIYTAAPKNTRSFPDAFADLAGLATAFSHDANDERPLDGANAEEKLRASEERYRALFENAPMAVFVCDREAVIQHYNRWAVDLWGREPKCGVEKHCGSVKLFLPDGTWLPHEQSPLVTVLQTGVPARNVEVLIERPDGTRLPVLVNFAALTNSRGAVVGAVTSFTDISDHKRVEEQLRQVLSELGARVAQRTAELGQINHQLRTEIAERVKTEQARQRLLSRLASAEEEERRRISRELHDEIGQHLVAMQFGLGALAAGEMAPADIAQLKVLREIAESIGGKVHELAVKLRPAALDDVGLLSTLKIHVQEWSTRTKIAVGLHTAGMDGVRFNPQIETTIYRITQEALNNVLLHAEANHVSLILERRDGMAVAILEDDGRGFDVDSLQAGGKADRLGLLGMKERAMLVGGELKIESAPGRGTTVFVRVPLTNKRSDE